MPEVTRGGGGGLLKKSVKYNFIMLKKGNGILRKNRGEGFEKSYLPLHGVGDGSKIAIIILT